MIILHKLCEKSEQELWEMLKENEWTAKHAEVAYYLVEIMKAAKKIEYMNKIQEAMEKEEKRKEGENEDEGGSSEFARGMRGGGSRRGRSRTGMYEFGYNADEEDEDEWFARGGGRRGGSRGGNRGGRNNYEYEYENYNQGGNYTHPQNDGRMMPPIVYTTNNKDYYEEKYKELLEDKWEREKKEKEKEKEKEHQGKATLPPPPK